MILLFAALIFSAGCDNRKREQELLAREVALEKKEHDLLLMEKALQVKEEELGKRERMLDSTTKSAIDTLSALYPNVPGIWNVTMRCTQTTCPGSAIGDTRTEQWELSFQKNTLIAKTISDKQLVRVYSGKYIAGTFELNAVQDSVHIDKDTRIIVRLQKTKENEMTGQREIIRADECRIVYSLVLNKQK